MKKEFGIEDLESDNRPIPGKRCHRGHGELTPEGTCSVCRKRSWMYSPLLHLGYGFATAALCFWVANSKNLLVGTYDFIVPFFLSISMLAWGGVTSVVQYALHRSNRNSIKRKESGPYKRRLPCLVCEDELDEKGWCRTCSRRRVRSIVVLLLLLIPVLGMNACFYTFVIGSSSPVLYILPIAVFLPPIIFSVIQYTDCLPKNN